MGTTLRGGVSKKLSQAEINFLSAGLKQPGGKLPLFDNQGQKIPSTTIRTCIEKGLAERWFANPMKPDWLVCRLTNKGRDVVSA